MKLAVFVIGEYRTLDDVHHTWGFKDIFDCEFFFSTWNKSIQKNDRVGVDINLNISEEMIKKKFPTAKIKITSYEESHHISFNNQIYHLKESLKLYNSTDKTHDYVFIIRPDLYFYGTDWNRLNQINQNKIYAHSRIELITNGREMIDELYFYGNPVLVDKLINNLTPDLMDLHNCPHNAFSKGFIKCNIYPESLKLNNIIYRPNNFGTQDLEKIYMNNKLWEESILYK